MRQLIKRSAWVVLAFSLLASAALGQTGKSKTKKQRPRRASQTAATKGNPSSTPTPAPLPEPVTTMGEDGVRRITPEEARKAFDTGRAVIVDVRGEASYNAGHVKGSLLISVDAVGAHMAELPPGKLIITYCS